MRLIKMNNYPLATSTWDDKELKAIQSVIDKTLTLWVIVLLNLARLCKRVINRKYCVMVSSGSSANLIGTAALFYTKNPLLKRGDEVIVPAMVSGLPLTSLCNNMD